MRSDILIRLAREPDLKSIVEIYNQAIKSGISTGDTHLVSLDDRKKWFEKFNDNFPIFVALENEIVIGYAYLSPYREGRKAMEKIAEVSFFVEQSNFNKGVGSMLLKQLIDVSVKTNKEFLIAFLLDLNIASINLLKKFGFTEMGRLPDAISFEDYRSDHLIYGLDIRL